MYSTEEEQSGQRDIITYYTGLLSIQFTLSAPLQSIQVNLKDWRMYTSVVEEPPDRKIYYVVLIGKEAPKLVLANSDFSMPVY